MFKDVKMPRSLDSLRGLMYRIDVDIEREVLLDPVKLQKLIDKINIGEYSELEEDEAIEIVKTLDVALKESLDYEKR